MRKEEPTEEDFKKAIKALERATWTCIACRKQFKSTTHPAELIILEESSYQGYRCKKCSPAYIKFKSTPL